MSKEDINTGDAPNDGIGDSLRTAGDKINRNFSELYQRVETENSVIRKDELEAIPGRVIPRDKTFVILTDVTRALSIRLDEGRFIGDKKIVTFNDDDGVGAIWIDSNFFIGNITRVTIIDRGYAEFIWTGNEWIIKGNINNYLTNN